MRRLLKEPIAWSNLIVCVETVRPRRKVSLSLMAENERFFFSRLKVVAKKSIKI